MKGADLPPKFQFAFRRTVFFLICVCIWIALGTLVLAVLNRGNLTKVSIFFLVMNSLIFREILWLEIE